VIYAVRGLPGVGGCSLQSGVEQEHLRHVTSKRMLAQEGCDEGFRPKPARQALVTFAATIATSANRMFAYVLVRLR
jgi:hypothetical protein